MQTFAKKSTALAFIYLVLSIPAINAARIKQATRAQAKGMEALAAENVALKQQLEAMKEVAEFTSELSKLKSEAKTGYWGESWATCQQRLEDLERREHKLEQRFEAGMEDGEMDVMEAGRVGLKSWSVASTLSTAGKNGCEWATSRQVNTSAMDRVMKEVVGKQECLPQATEYLEKAKDDNMDPKEAKANALAILFSKDCKLPTDDEKSEEAEKTFEELAQIEDDAEAGALAAAQQFADSMQGANGTALLQSRSSSQIFGVIFYFMFTMLVLLMYILQCTVIYTILATVLTMVFLALKALFMYAIGSLDEMDFSAEMSYIMKPMITLSATACTLFSQSTATMIVYAVGFVDAGLSVEAASYLGVFLGLGVSGGAVVKGGDTIYHQLTDSDEATVAPEATTEVDQE